MNHRSNNDPYERLQQLYALRARSEENMKQIDEEIAAEEEHLNPTPLEWRAWIRRINRGAAWTGVIGTAGALREAARESPGITAAIGGVTVALGAGATALAIGIGGSQPPPGAGPRPSVSAPPIRPSTPPVAGPERPERPESRRPRTEPPRGGLPARVLPDVEPVRGLPKVPAAPPARPTPPPEMRQDPPAAVEPTHTCVADVRVLALRIAVLCR